jgi:phosphoribosylamine--glycine ligase
MRILVVGRGAREHALVWRLSRSPGVTLFCAPGNAGTRALAETIPLRETDTTGLAQFARENRLDLVVIGPEAPLAAGLADAFAAAGVPVFGPRQAAAEIESSKLFSKALMERAGIPTARAERFREAAAALAYLDRLTDEAKSSVVVKADGLAAGKGVIVCDSLDKAREAVGRLMDARLFGGAGDSILVEECLVGEEISRFDLCDGMTTRTLTSAQDYKRALDGDRGPNTGGMGAYAPAPVVDGRLSEEITARIVQPALHALSEQGRLFQGCLYTGLMLTERGPQVIEFNCRFGDPETEVVLPLLEGDFAGLLLACAEGRLSDVPIQASASRAVCVVMASPGYPDAYPTGLPIEGLDRAEKIEGVLVFHAGTRLDGGRVVTDGGRVLAVTGVGASFAEARTRAYEAVAQIQFEGAHYRRDIALRVTTL